MANEIRDLHDASTALTITVASLATSTVGVGRQSTIVNNTSNLYMDVLVYVKIELGTSPVGDKSVQVYLIRDDNHASNHRSDGAGASDAGLTILNAPLIGVMRDLSSPSTGDILFGEFLVHRPGPKWGIGIVHDTGVNLDSTGGNHWVRFVGLNPEIQ